VNGKAVSKEAVVVSQKKSFEFLVSRKTRRHSVVGYQISADGFEKDRCCTNPQLSIVSYQLSVINYQFSFPFSRLPAPGFPSITASRW
jgi:hypothetical protein